MIEGGGPQIAFQAVVDLRQGRVAGYEALSRFPDSPSGGTEMWFAAARSRGRILELERLAHQRILGLWDTIPDDCFLTINVEADTLGQPGGVAALLARGDLRGLVIEVTEHRPLQLDSAAGEVLQELRNAGAAVALDDAGAGHSGLRHLLELKPEFVKLDRSLVSGLDRDEAKAALVELLGIFVDRQDSWVIAEGVETEAEALRLASMGVPLAQGWWFTYVEAGWPTPDSARLAAVRGASGDSFADTLEGLVESPPTVRHAAEVMSLGSDDLAVVIDGSGRPTAMLRQTGLNEWEACDATRVNVATSPAAAVQRIALRGSDRLPEPLLVTDDLGRLCGVVRVPRLLAQLASLSV